MIESEELVHDAVSILTQYKALFIKKNKNKKRRCAIMCKSFQSLLNTRHCSSLAIALGVAQDILVSILTQYKALFICGTKYSE